MKKMPEIIAPIKCDTCRKATPVLCLWVRNNERSGRVLKKRGSIELVVGCRWFEEGPLPPLFPKATPEQMLSAR